MATRSKYFRVATEGQTTDGRKITRQQIEQMAKNYDPKKYGARIWMEHFRSIFPDSAFRAYGDVLSVKAETVEDGKLALFAEIEPTPDLITINRAKQKIYSSIELDPSFSDTGEAYLIGLGITDSPASLGTDVLTFSASANANPFTARKQKADNLFSSAEPIVFDFIDAPADDGKGLFARVVELLSGKEKSAQRASEDMTKAIEAVAQHQSDLSARFNALEQKQQDQDAMAARLDDLDKQLKADRQAFDQFKAEVEKTPAPTTARPAATGGNGLIETDC